MNDQEREVREPVRDSTEQAQAAPSAAPSAPPRERDRNAETSYETDDRTTGAIDERAATTKTEPMGRLNADRQESGRAQASSIDRSGTPIQDERGEYYAGRWDEIQSGFVDDPRRTVEQADRLVAEVIDHLEEVFREERARLESQWSKSGKVETEDLRLAMQRYRDFFRTLVGR